MENWKDRAVKAFPHLMELAAQERSAILGEMSVGVYPAGTSFSAGGAAPRGAASSATLAMPIGGVDDAVVLVRGAQSVGLRSPTIQSPLRLETFFAHYVSVDGTPVPDALLPWDGTQRSTEKTNQPVWLQVTVPDGTPAGTYSGSVDVLADGTTTVVPISVTVAPVTLPAPSQVQGSLLTAFNVSPQTYGNEVNKLYGITAQTSLPSLFGFLSSYRLSPNNWGYGEPKYKSGYTSNRRWWLDKSAEMVQAVGSPRQFAAMALPLSNNRAPAHAYVAGLSPFKPQTWCGYLRSVHRFWDKHGWLGGSYPYLYGLDEPGAVGFKVVQRQAEVAHECFPGSHVIVTGRPSPDNKYLWNGGRDDVDGWVVLGSRYYGKYTNPSLTRRHISHATVWLKYIDGARHRGKAIWTYTYPNPKIPGFTATEPVADPRLFVDWAALEGISGLLYGEGTTTYGKTNPLDSLDRKGAFVLVYPGRNGPVASARLEEIREGIEDWEILDVVRQKHGAAAVNRILGGLFSTTSKGAKLACTVGCPLKSSTPFAWPLWSHDSTTAGKIAQMRASALAAAAS